MRSEINKLKNKEDSEAIRLPGIPLFIRRLREEVVSGVAWCCGMGVFVVLGSLLLLSSRVIDPRRYDRAVKAACRLVLRSTGIRVQVDGGETLDPARTFLFIGNHVNIFDVFVYYGYIPHSFRGVELEDHFKWVFYGPIIRRLGMIPISQTNGRSALKSLNNARKALASGTSILILPEGGRTPDGRLQPFKRGAFLLARKARADIVPVVMTGAFEIYHKGARLIRPGRMHLHIGKPLDFGSIQHLDPSRLEALVRGKMSAPAGGGLHA